MGGLRTTVESLYLKAVHLIPNSPHMSHVGILIIGFVRLSALVWSLVHYRTADLYPAPASAARLLLPVTLAYVAYNAAVFAAFWRLPTGFTSDGGKRGQLLLDFAFAIMITATGSSPDSPAHWMFFIPIAIAGWYYDVAWVAAVVTLSALASVVIGRLTFGAESTWVTNLYLISFYSTVGLLASLLKNWLLYQAKREAEEAVLAAAEGAYLIDRDFTLVAASRGRRVGQLCAFPADGQPIIHREDLSVLQSAGNMLAPYVVKGLPLPDAEAEPAVLHELMSAVDEPMLVESPEKVIVGCNDALLALVGATRDELVGHHYLTLVVEGDHEFVARHSEQRRLGVSGQYETRLRTLTGDPVRVWVHARPVMEGGTLRRTVVSFANLTTRDRTQRVFEQYALAAADLAAHEHEAPNGVLKAILQQLSELGLNALVLQHDSNKGQLLVREVSIDRAMLRSLKRKHGLQLRALDIDLAAVPTGRRAIDTKQPVLVPDSSALVMELTAGATGGRDLAKLARLVRGIPAVVIPASTTSSSGWVLGVWGTDLRKDDVAAVADYWRKAADALTQAEERLWHKQHDAPRSKLWQARHGARQAIVSAVRLARIESHSNNVTLLGVQPESVALYPIVSDPPVSARDHVGNPDDWSLGIVRQAVAARSPVVVSSRSHPHFQPRPPGWEKIRSEAAVPIMVSDVVVAVLDCQCHRSRGYDGNTRRTLARIRDEIEASLESCFWTQGAWTSSRRDLAACPGRSSPASRCGTRDRTNGTALSPM